VKKKLRKRRRTTTEVLVDLLFKKIDREDFLIWDERNKILYSNKELNACLNGDRVQYNTIFRSTTRTGF